MGFVDKNRIAIWGWVSTQISLASLFFNGNNWVGCAAGCVRCWSVQCEAPLGSRHRPITELMKCILQAPVYVIPLQAFRGL